MKSKSMISIILLLAVGFFSFAGPVQVTSEIKEVTVFFQGAQLTREAQVKIPEGINELVFPQLPTNLDASSIQVRAKGELNILSVSYRTNFLEAPALNSEIKTMEDSLKYFKNRLELNRASLKVYEEEEALLAANRSLGGSERGVQVAELKAAADFLRHRLQEIKTHWLKVRSETEKDEESYNRINRQLSRLRGQSLNHVGEVVVQVSAKASVNTRIDLTYNIYQAGWQPVYDVRVTDVDQDIELMLKANVFQNTGEDWNNVKLSFSTGNPRQWGQKPQLSQWFLKYEEEMVFNAMGMVRLGVPIQEKYTADNRDIEEMEMALPQYADATTVADLIQVSQGRTIRNFVVNTPYHLPSGRDMKVVEIENHRLPAHYEYYVVPKLDTDAFLVARLPNWQDYALLPGEANLFMEGTFLGKTYIDPNRTADTLELSLGRDKNIIVKRERIKETSRRSLLGNKITETLGWEISARNNKPVSVVLNIQDQIPLSTSQDLEVSLEEMSGASHDKDRGFIHWRMELRSGEISQKILRYSVRYPKNKRISLE